MDNIILTDSHAHLADPRLCNDRAQLLRQCRANGVGDILVNAARPSEWEDVIELSRLPGIYGALGLHPFFIDDAAGEPFIELLRMTMTEAPADAKLVAIGEIGLDAWNGRDALPLQRRIFEKQLSLAIDLGLPVCIHNRRTWSDFFETLKANDIRHLRGYCHNFSGSLDVLENVLELGLMISFGGPAAHPGARKIHEAMRHVPLTSILTETDCPDLPPVQAQTTQSRPWHGRYVLETLSDIRQCSLLELSRQIQNNFRALITFPIPCTESNECTLQKKSPQANNLLNRSVN